MSLGGRFNETIKDACNVAHEQGHLLVASAGNSGEAAVFTYVGYPAALETVIAVAASTVDDERAEFSSTGPEVELIAPGRLVLSTELDNQYGARSGTSVAAPHVSGAAALVWAANPDLTNEEVRGFLRAGVEDLGLPFDHQGFGLVAADLAVDLAAPGERGDLTGTVTAQLSGDPVPEAVLIADGPRRRITTTDAEGRYAFLDLPAGDYTVSAGSPGYEWNSKEVTIMDGVNLGEDFELVAALPGTLEGTVTDPAAEPLGGVTVSIEGTDLSATTQADGSYVITDIPAWEYRVTVTGAEHYADASQRVLIESGLTSALDFQLEPKLVVADIRYSHTGPHLDIIIVVRDGFGAPVEGAFVRINIFHSETECSTEAEDFFRRNWSYTDSNGEITFWIRQAPDGFYTTMITRLRHDDYVTDWDNSVAGQNRIG